MDDLHRAVMAEFVRLSSDPELERSVTTDSSRLIAAASIVATRALQLLAFEMLNGAEPVSPSPCLRRAW
jgi:hypothetical protein